MTPKDEVSDELQNKFNRSFFPFSDSAPADFNPVNGSGPNQRGRK
jgi:hypothetical protein